MSMDLQRMLLQEEDTSHLCESQRVFGHADNFNGQSGRAVRVKFVSHDPPMHYAARCYRFYAPLRLDSSHRLFASKEYPSISFDMSFHMYMLQSSRPWALLPLKPFKSVMASALPPFKMGQIEF